MTDSPCVASMVRLRREPRLCTLPLSAKAMWLQFAVRAAEEPDGVLAVGTAYGLHTGIAMLIQCAEAEVKPNLDILIAAGFVKPIGDTGIRVLGVVSRAERPAAPISQASVEAAMDATPLHHRKMNGRRGGRPRRGETPEQALQRRQREIIMPVTGGKNLETKIESKIETEKTWKVAENRQKGETEKPGNLDSRFSRFSDSAKEEKKEEKQPPMTTSVVLETKKPGNLETWKPATRPVDEADVDRITKQIGAKITMSPQAVTRSLCFVRGWLMEGISERTIMRAVAEKVESFKGTISSARFFDEIVRQMHARRAPTDDLPSATKVHLESEHRRFSALSLALQDNLQGPVEKRSRREMEMSFAFDGPRLEWGLPLLCFKSQEQFEHWKAIWDSGAWISPYADERAAS